MLTSVAMKNLRIEPIPCSLETNLCFTAGYIRSLVAERLQLTGQLSILSSSGPQTEKPRFLRDPSLPVTTTHRITLKLKIPLTSSFAICTSKEEIAGSVSLAATTLPLRITRFTRQGITRSP